MVVKNSTYNYSLSGGSLAGAMDLTKKGTGALTLGMANSYTGGSTLSGGTVRLGNGSALGVGPITFTGGALSSDGTTARAVANAIVLNSSSTALGDAVNNGTLTFSGPVDYSGISQNIESKSDVIFSGSMTNGGLNQKWGSGLLTYSNVVGTVTGGGSQWQIAWGDLAVNGGLIDKPAGGIRIGSTAANGISRLVITNGGQVLMSGSGQNARVGNDQSPNPAATTSTNILDLSGTLAWTPGPTAGAILMGPGGAFAQVNLRAGGLLQIGRFLKGGTTITEVNFLGGTLAAANDSTIFMTNLGSANISSPAGAIIDSGVYSITIAQALNDPLASGGGVIKKGSGTLRFTGGGSYTGATIVQQGTLFVGSSHPAGSSVIVSNGAAIGAASSLPATVPNLTLNTSRVVADYGNAGSGTTMTLGGGGVLNLTGTCVVELTGINLAVGTYTVLDYSAGTKTGTGSFSATPILPPGVAGTVTDSGGLVQVTITSTSTTRIWYGYDNTVTSTTTTNWDTTTTAWDIGLAAFANGQGVLFDDTRFAGNNTNINIAVAVSPVAVTVNNVSSIYTFNSDSGAGIGGSAVLIKTGTGRLDINTLNTYSGATTVSGGTLGGTGVISGPVSIGAAAALSPGSFVLTNRIGTLTISNSLALNGNVAIDLDKSAAQSNDVVNVTGALTYGGTLTPVNIGTNALVAGDSFQIFPAGGSGSIAVSGSPGAGLNWNFSAASGVLGVVSSTPSPTPLNYTPVSPGVIQFSWTGAFKLQYQTNAASVGLKTNWVDYPITTNPVNVTNNPAVPTTFFRLKNL
jgi:autotransporter-associated beta strand protein